MRQRAGVVCGQSQAQLPRKEIFLLQIKYLYLPSNITLCLFLVFLISMTTCFGPSDRHLAILQKLNLRYMQCSLCGMRSHNTYCCINPLNAELNPICHLLALLGAQHILHVSRIGVKYMNRGADKSLGRPGRKQATTTEDFEFHISYL